MAILQNHTKVARHITVYFERPQISGVRHFALVHTVPVQCRLIHTDTHVSAVLSKCKLALYALWFSTSPKENAYTK